MRVAILIDSLAVGGAQKHVVSLATELIAREHEVVLYVMNDIVHECYRQPLEAAGVCIHVFGRVAVVSGLIFLSLPWRFRREGVGIVVTVLFASTVVGRCSAKLAGMLPVLTCLQARNIDYHWWQRIAILATASLTDFTVSNSSSALHWAAHAEGVVLKRSSVISNALAVPFEGPLPSWAELNLESFDAAQVIGSFGRLNWQKGYDLLLEALPKLLFQHPRLRLVIFGEGPERSKLEVQRSALGLDGYVAFPGEVHTAARFLGKIALYVQPSRFEGTPNAVEEALAARVKIVAADVDGVSEIVPPADAIFIRCEPNSVSALIEAMERALKIAAVPASPLWTQDFAAFGSAYESVLSCLYYGRH